MNRLSIALLVCAFVLASSQKLQQYNINKNTISVSGISSGGAMAIQYHVSHSSYIIGAGIIAGPPFYCANDEVAYALTACMSQPDLLSVDELWAATKYAFSNSDIDDPSNLNNSRVWLYSGTQDTTVYPGVMEKCDEYYAGYVAADNLVFVNDIPSVHGWITSTWGNNCSDFGSPFINNCHYDAAGEILQHIYGTLNRQVSQVSANLLKFSQTDYIAQGYDVSSLSLDPYGYIYVPSSCQNGSECNLHISFHGCEQGYGYVGTDFVRHSFLNEWAESNNIIVLYPQAADSYFEPSNPDGCWDWWGYTTSNYAYKSGPQMVTVENMINALIGTN